MTRAPRSASCRVANGPAITCSSATTVTPSSGLMQLGYRRSPDMQRDDDASGYTDPQMRLGREGPQRIAARVIEKIAACHQPTERAEKQHAGGTILERSPARWNVIRDQHSKDDQGEHGCAAMDLHEKARPRRRGHLPADAGREQDKQGDIKQDPLGDGQTVHSSLRTR